jgi:ubiquinone/menaquinone biosynthesis C-methylase UbiE
MLNATLSQWNNAADWYDQNMGESGDEMNQKLIKPLILELAGELTNKTVLDVGCGSGYFSAELSQAAEKVIATDFSPEFVSLCQKKYQSQLNLSFVVQDVMQPLNFENKSVDVVVVKMVLQYVEDIHLFAKEANRVLKPNGKVVVAVDHPFNTQFHYAQSLTGVKNPKYQGLKDYFNREPHTKLSLWNKVELTWYPKTVGDYLQPFVEAGLKLTGIKEAGENNTQTIIPRIFAFSFQS